MRPIEFRGKCLHDGRWIYGYYSGIGGDCYIQFEEWYIEKVVLETVGQFTGLTDKNGTKIFEGDRVKVEGVKKSIIKYRNDLAAFIWESEFTWGLLANTNPDYLEVIGNIHEGAGEMNPEYNALEKCVAEAKQYSPKPAAGWYRFEKNVLKGTRATEYEIQHFYRISPKWDKKNHFISYKMVEYGHRPTERYPWMDKSKAAIRFPQTAV